MVNASRQTLSQNHFKIKGRSKVKVFFYVFLLFRKFFENLGPIKIKNKKQEDEIISEDKTGFWLPATPPSQRTEDIFVGKKFSKPPKQVKFRDDV